MRLNQVVIFLCYLLQDRQRKIVTPKSEFCALPVSGIRSDHRQSPVSTASLWWSHGNHLWEIPPSQLWSDWHCRTIPQRGEDQRATGDRGNAEGRFLIYIIQWKHLYLQEVFYWSEPCKQILTKTHPYTNISFLPGRSNAHRCRGAGFGRRWHP